MSDDPVQDPDQPDDVPQLDQPEQPAPEGEPQPQETETVKVTTVTEQEIQEDEAGG